MIKKMTSDRMERKSLNSTLKRLLYLSVDTVLPNQTSLDGTHVTVMEEVNATATTQTGDKTC